MPLSGGDLLSETLSGKSPSLCNVARNTLTYGSKTSAAGFYMTASFYIIKEVILFSINSKCSVSLCFQKIVDFAIKSTK